MFRRRDASEPVGKLWSYARASARVVALACVALGVVGLLDLSGLVDATDVYLRSQYRYVISEPGSRSRVVFVAVDDATLADWGGPPWASARLEGLVTAVAAGRPELIAVVEPAARLPGVDHLRRAPSVRALVERGLLLLPPATGQPGQPGAAFSPDGRLDGPLLRDPADRAVLTVAGLALPHLVTDGDLARELLSSGRLPSPFRLSAERLPSVSAFRVAAGDLPSDTFLDRIVIVGYESPQLATPLVTPVGPMSLAQIHTEAFIGAAAGRLPAQSGGAVTWGILAAVALVVLALSRQRTAGGALLAAGVVAVVVVLVDATLWVWTDLRWGAGGALWAVVAAVTVGRVAHDRRRAAWDRRVAARVLREARGALHRSSMEAALEGDELWKQLKRLARTYVDFDSFFGELPPGEWHLRLRAVSSTVESAIVERRRDIRRNPYRKALLTLRPAWVDGFLEPAAGLRALFVPITVASHVLGLWTVVIPVEHKLTERERSLIQILARQLAAVLTRRELGSSEQGGERGLLRDGGALGVEAVKVLRERLKRTERILETIPVGVLVATLWGEVEYQSATLRRILGELGAAEAARQSLPELLHTLGGIERDDASAILRRLLSEGPEVILWGPTDMPGDPPSFVLHLSCVADPDGGGLSDDLVPLRFLLTIARVHVTPGQGGAVHGGDEGSPRDCRATALRAVRRARAACEADACLVWLVFQDPLPRTAVRSSHVEDALASLLATTLEGTGRRPGEVTLSVESGDDSDLIVTVEAPSLFLGEQALAALLEHAGPDPAHEDSQLLPLSAVSSRLALAGARLDVQSSSAEGTVIRIAVAEHETGGGSESRTAGD